MRGQTNASNIGGTVGDDTHPIKIVDDVPTPVTNELQTKLSVSRIYQNPPFYAQRYGNIVQVTVFDYHPTVAYDAQIISGLPKASMYTLGLMTDGAAAHNGAIWIQENSGTVMSRAMTTNQSFATMIYFTNDP